MSRPVHATDRPPGGPPRWAGWAMAFGLVVLGLGEVSHARTIDVDIFHSMALIREALALGAIPKDDPFAYTSTVSPVVHHEWGTGAVLYLFVVGLGLGARGLALLRLLLLASTAALAIAAARRRGARWSVMTVMAPAAMLLFAPGLSPVRAHLFTFLFVALLLWVFERERQGEWRWLLLWPPVFVAWLNLHGGFVVGLGLLGLHTLERMVAAGTLAYRQGADLLRAGWTAARRTRHLILALAVAAPLLLVNPYGWGYVPYLWHGLTMDRPDMTEWYPLWDPVFGGAPLILYIASVLVAGYAIARSESGRRQGIPILGVTALAALGSARLLPIYAVAWMAYVAPMLSATPLTGVVDRIWRRYARPVGAVALIAASLGLARLVRTDALAIVLPTEPGDHRLLYPAGAVRYLDSVDFRGNLMTPFGVGAYVSWELHPRVKVGMDSRYEVAYEPGLAEETARVYRGSADWRPFLDRFPTDAVLVPSASALDSLMTAPGGPDGRQANREWVEVFRDDAYAVFATPQRATGLPRVDRRGRPIPGVFP